MYPVLCPGLVGRAQLVRVLLEVAPLQVRRAVALDEQQAQAGGQERLGVKEPVENSLAEMSEGARRVGPSVVDQQVPADVDRMSGPTASRGFVFNRAP